MPVTQEEVLSALKQCYDPEIPVNIVDLGLIYEVRFEPVPEEKQDVTIDMTLTAQGCPAHVQISDQVRSRLEQLMLTWTASVPDTPSLCTNSRHVPSGSRAKNRPWPQTARENTCLRSANGGTVLVNTFIVLAVRSLR